MAQIQCLSQILTGEILRHGTEKRAGRAGNGHARPERSGAEAADIQRPVRERYGGLLLRPEKRKKCRLRWEVYNLVVYYLRELVLHHLSQTAVDRMLLRRPRITGRKRL